LPLSRGYVNGKIAYFIATDASDNSTALEISRNLKYKVNFSPSLALIPESSRQQGYEFLNGVRGQGAFGFQLPVASKLPGDKDYSPIVQLNFVKWNSNITNSDNAYSNRTSNTAIELRSVALSLVINLYYLIIFCFSKICSRDTLNANSLLCSCEAHVFLLDLFCASYRYL